MPTPIDVIANAIHVADPDLNLSTPRLAEVAANALAADDIVTNAVQALLADGWRYAHEGPQGQSELSDEDLANIARTVLRSVSGA